MARLRRLGTSAIEPTAPVLPLRSAVVFPLAVVPLAVGRPGSVKLVNDAMRANRFVALIAQKNDEGEETDPKELHTVGTFAVIHQLARAADGTLRIVVQGLERIRVVDYIRTEPYLVARVAPAPDRDVQGTEADALRRAAVDLFKRVVGFETNNVQPAGPAPANVLSTPPGAQPK